MAKILSGKVKTNTPGEVSPDRYEFLELADAEPNLGEPTADGQVLTSDASGNRTWTTISNRVAYTHHQGIASAVWHINHNLGFYPNVTVEDSAENVVEGDIAYTDFNNLTITFSASFGGIAYLS